MHNLITIEVLYAPDVDFGLRRHMKVLTYSASVNFLTQMFVCCENDALKSGRRLTSDVSEIFSSTGVSRG